MTLVSNFGGYRLSMASNQEFQLAESIQVYKGIIAKLMVFLDLAFYRQFLDKNGQTITLAVNKRSLGHYTWRHNRCRDDGVQYSKNMANLYRISHQIFHKKYQDHKFYTKEMCYQIAQRILFPKKLLSFSEFFKKVQEQAPLRGCFYKIKKDGETKGYLLGSIHCGNELLLNLNPKINKALAKSQIIAAEKRIDQIGKTVFIPKEHHKKKNSFFIKNLKQDMRKVHLNFDFGIEKCIHKKIQTLHGSSKELVGLETDEELHHDYSIFLEELDLSSDNNDGLSEFRNILSGDVDTTTELANEYQKTEHGANMIKRNHNIVERAEGYFKKGRTFIIAGDLHLKGDQGIKKLFEANYTI